ncbi:MAG: FMN-binding protein, partial [Candidatus Electrothrix sp. AR3]|nr:FMN-binding protein [Candidatus Electrothrix sp. AR3]
VGGGGVENPNWQAGWLGKKIYNQEGKPIIRVVKGKATSTGEANLYQVDGVSGATLTMQGVNNLMRFWFGEHGFAPFLQRQQEGKKDARN